MKQFINLVKLDSTVVLRNGFVAVVLILAVIYSLMVNYAIPETTGNKIGASEYFLDQTSNKKYEAYLLATEKKDNVVQTMDQLKEKLAQDNMGIGILFQEEKVTIIKQGHEQEGNIHLLVAALDRFVKEVNNVPAPQQIETRVLKPETNKIPLNKLVIPLLLATDITLIGFMLIAAMIFQEKKEGSIEVYGVSPGKTVNYVLSKLTVNSLLALLFSIIFGLFTLGTEVNYFFYSVIVFLAAFLFSALGMLIGQFYNSISDFIFVAVAFFTVMLLPVTTYFVPTFSLPFFKLVPSYSIIFGLKNLLFATEYNPWPLIGLLLVEGMVVFILTNYSINKVLLKRNG